MSQSSQAYTTNGNGQMTIPQNGGHANGVSSTLSASAAAAAADASAMPPPPPHATHAHGSMRAAISTTGAQPASPATFAAKPVAISAYSAPRTIAKPTHAPASIASSTYAAAKVTTSLGIPSPLAQVPMPAMSAPVAIRTAVARPPGVLSVAGNNYSQPQGIKMAAPTVVRSPLTPAAATVKYVSQQPVRSAVPRPVLSSAAHTTTAATARVAPTHYTSAVVGQTQQHVHHVVPKYLAKAPAPPPSQRVVGTPSAAVATRPVMHQRLVVPKPTLTSPVLQPVSSISTPAPATILQQQYRPATVTSGQTTHQHQVVTHHVTHMPSMVSHSPGMVAQPPSPMPPPSPIPTESIAATTSTGSSSSGGGGGGNSSKKKSGHPLRRGKWTSEEEAYAARLINEFKAGLLPLTDGTTLRNFLSKLLNCDPMRISKKFVGNNCIGKQVFRRRVADINRLTPEQIQQMRVELSELERRFFDRVAATNRVKSPGMSATITGGLMANVTGGMMSNGIMTSSVIPTSIINVPTVVAGGTTKVVTREELDQIESNNRPPTPPWLRPPANYKPKGKFGERLKAKEARRQMAIAAAQAAAAPPPPPAAITIAVPPPPITTTTTTPIMQQQKVLVSSTPPLVEVKVEAEKARVVIQRSETSMDRLVQAAANDEIPRTESALEQLARTASAAKFVEDIVNGDSSLGEAQSPGGKKLSQSTLQGSFEALMSLDLHSVENLVELASSSQSSALLSELVNKSSTPSNHVAGGSGIKKNNQSSANLSTRMESFIKSLSSANLLKPGMDSGAALSSLLNAAGSSNTIFDAETFSSRIESCTGFSQLRAEDGLANGSHNSVEDFLSLVASGDIPHQDPNMLQVPLQKVMQQGTAAAGGSNHKAGSSIMKRKLSQQQLVALASRLSGGHSVIDLAEMGGSALKKRKKN